MARKPKRSKNEQQQAAEFLKDVRNNVESYWKTTATLREMMKEDLDLVIGGDKQWLPGDRSKLTSEQRPVLAFNIVFGLVNFLCGWEIERHTDPRYFPKGIEDEELSRYSTSLAKHVYELRDGLQAQSRIFRWGIGGGLGVMDVGHSFDFTDDLLEGDPTLRPLDPFSWGCEPFARRPDRNDARYMYELLWFTPEEAMERWPSFEERLKPSSLNTFLEHDPWTDSAEHLMKEMFDRDTGRLRVMRYWYQVNRTVTLLVNNAAGPAEEATRIMDSEQEAEAEVKRVRDAAGAAVARSLQVQQINETFVVQSPIGEERAFADPDSAELFVQTMQEQMGALAASQLQIISRPTSTLRVAHLTAWDLLDDNPSPHGVDWRYPYAVFIPYQETDDYDSIKGIVRDAKDPQREINWHYAMLLDKLVRGPKNPVFFPKAEHADLAKIRNEIHRAGFVGEYSTTPPTILTTENVVNQELQLINGAVTMLLQITGINAELIGQTTQKTVSGRAIQARQSGGLVGLNYLMMNWQHTKKYIADLILRRIKLYYSVEKMHRIIGDEARMQQAATGMAMPVGDPRAALAKLKQLTTTDFTAVADFQEASPSARQAMFLQLMNLLAIGVPVPGDILLQASDVPYRERILTALKQQGMQQPNEAVARVLGASQGQSKQPTGVNAGA